MLGNILLKRARDNAGNHVLKHIRKHAARENAADVLFISFGTTLATTFCRLLLRQLPSPDSSKHVAPERIISRAHGLAPSSQSTPAWLLTFKYIANRNTRVKKGVPALSNRWALAISSRVEVGVRKYHRHDAISAVGQAFLHGFGFVISDCVQTQCEFGPTIPRTRQHRTPHTDQNFTTTSHFTPNSEPSAACVPSPWPL